MGYVHSRERIRAAIVEVAQKVGLADLTYRLVAEQLGIPTRTVVYYVPSKKDLVVAVLETVAGEVEGAMRDELGDGPLSPVEAFAGMWRALATDRVDPFFRLYIELVGLAASRKEPFAELMFGIYHQWVDWLEPRMAGPVEHRRAAAAAAYAQVDGLLMARCIGAREVTDAAARWTITSATDGVQLGRPGRIAPDSRP